MAAPTDKVGVYLSVGVYIFLYLVALFLLPNLLIWLGGYFFGGILSQFAAAIWANWLALRIYSRIRLVDLGLQWNRASARNLALGLAGGTGAAALVLLPPLAAHLARLGPARETRATWDVFLFTTAVLLLGSAGEEILFRGFILTTLRERLRFVPANLITSLLFTMIHWPYHLWAGMPLPRLAMLSVSLFIIGYLLGYLVKLTNSLWPSVGAHIANNFLVGFLRS